MIKKILSLLKRKKGKRPSRLRFSGRVWKIWEHKFWGDNIYWWKVEEGRIYGHCLGLKKGDEIQSGMESGKIGRFILTEIDYEDDPRDMFFGNVEFRGYAGE